MTENMVPSGYKRDAMQLSDAIYKNDIDGIKNILEISPHRERLLNHNVPHRLPLVIAINQRLEKM